MPVRLTEVKATALPGYLPAKRDVDGHLVDLPLVREAIVAGVGEKFQSVIVRIHGIFETRSASLQAYMSLRQMLGWKWGGGGAISSTNVAVGFCIIGMLGLLSPHAAVKHPG